MNAPVDYRSQLLIRTQVDPGVGTTPIMRSATLAKSYVALGGRATIACTQYLPGALRRRLEKDGIHLADISPDTLLGDATQTRDLAENLQADWIVVDGPRFDDSYQQVLKLSLSKLAVVHDYGPTSQGRADLVIDQRLQFDAPHCTQRTCGPQFALLRHDLARASSELTTPRMAKRILIDIAGSGDLGPTLACLQAITAMPEQKLMSLDVIVPHDAAQVESIRELARESQASVRLHPHRDRIMPLLSQLHLAIVEGGSNVYELACAGVPTVLLSDTPIQQHAQSWMHSIHSASLESCQSLTDELARLIHSWKRRRDLSRRAISAVDRKGGQRIARRLYAEQFQFRGATATDARQIWTWNTADSNRVPMGTPPTWNQHHAEFLRQLDDHLLDVWMIEHDDEAVGSVELKFASSDTEAQLSVTLSPVLEQNPEWASTIIESACQRTFDSEDIELIESWVDPRSATCRQIFLEAGFVNCGSTSFQGQPYWQMYLHRFPTAGQSKAAKTSWKKSA